MNSGTLFGGPELFPGSLVHVPPQFGGFGLVELPKPLKLEGAGPPLSEFLFAHCAPQNVTCWPTTALRSPMTNPGAAGVGVGVGVGERLGFLRIRPIYRARYDQFIDLL